MVKLERAKLEDAEQITKVKIAAYNKEINKYLGRDGGPSGYDKVESEKYIINNFIAYKIVLDAEIIGGLFLIPEGMETMLFEDFVIHPIFQGKGYGYKIMCMIEELYSKIKEWRLSTPVFSVGNQHLYEKFGYREVSRDEDEVYYRKILSDHI